LPILSPQLTAAAGNYVYVNSRLWEGQTSPWRPAADVISPFSPTLTYLSTPTFGTLAPLGQASKFLSFFSAWIADGRRFLPAPSLFSTWTSAVDYCWPTAAIGFLYIYDLPLRLWLASTTSFYDLPLWPASMPCLYGLPLRSASTVCLYGLPLRSAFILSSPSSSLSISCSSGTSIFLFYMWFMCLFFFNSWNYFSISSSKYAVEECDTYLLLTQSLPCYYCLIVFVLFLAHVCSSLYPPA
jgi:hypothetical protein